MSNKNKNLLEVFNTNNNNNNNYYYYYYYYYYPALYTHFNIP
jgi:hypothetical protein